MALTRRLPAFRNVVVRPLTRDELPRLNQDRAKATLAKLRDSHHRVARLFATGLRMGEVCERTGYSYNRIQTLQSDPSFQELVEHYRKLVTESFIASADEYYDLATRNMLAAERHIADQIEELDEKDELLPIKTALAISRDAADRFGYGKKQTNLNVNMDFAKNLEGMLRRSGKTIEGTPNPQLSRPLPPRPIPAQSAPVPSEAEAEPVPLRRRA